MAAYDSVTTFLWHGMDQITSIPEGENCPICISPYHGTEEEHNRCVRTRSCGHIFHTMCLQKWISEQQKNTCPMCRGVFFPPTRTFFEYIANEDTDEGTDEGADEGTNESADEGTDEGTDEGADEGTD